MRRASVRRNRYDSRGAGRKGIPKSRDSSGLEASSRARTWFAFRESVHHLYVCLQIALFERQFWDVWKEFCDTERRGLEAAERNATQKVQNAEMYGEVLPRSRGWLSRWRKVAARHP